MDSMIRKFGFWSGVLACTATIVYVGVQLLQLARVLTFPSDEILIFGTSLAIAFPFLLEILALHYITPPTKRFWSHGALVFTILYTVFVLSAYVVQLSRYGTKKERAFYGLN